MTTPDPDAPAGGDDPRAGLPTKRRGIGVEAVGLLLLILGVIGLLAVLALVDPMLAGGAVCVVSILVGLALTFRPTEE